MKGSSLARSGRQLQMHDRPRSLHSSWLTSRIEGPLRALSGCTFFSEAAVRHPPRMPAKRGLCILGFGSKHVAESVPLGLSKVEKAQERFNKPNHI